MAGASSWLQNVLQARFLVAALGETAHPSWWRCDVTNVTSLHLLERLYPRTFAAASLETATRVAAIEHDAHIGIAGVYHLFRLPLGDEATLHAYSLSPTGQDSIRALVALSSVDAHMTTLMNLALAEDLPHARGPVAVGSTAHLHDGTTLPRICAAYVAGFAAQQPVYPYLMKADAQ